MPLILLAGCPVGGPADKTETGAGTDSADTASTDTGACADRLSATSPVDGAVGVYFHEPITLSFTGDGSAALIEVRDPAGTPASLTSEWTPGGSQVVLNGALVPSTDYTIHVELCGLVYDTAFQTSAIGSLDITPEELVGRTYTFTLADAEITEPEILEMFDDSKLITPLGFMVESADASQMDLLGAVLTLQDGTLVQVSDADTWDFPTADFSAAPYFDTRIDALSFAYVGTSGRTVISLYDFQFDGTFSPDGSSIVSGHVDTLVDSRTLGPLFGLADSPDSVCIFAADFSVECIPCPDGEPYCLHTIGEDITAPLVPDLTLTPYPVVGP